MRSSVVKKALMAVTGLVLICFLLMHMFGNLKIFAGPDDYNYYAGWLKELVFYPILPHGWFIWVFRIFILICLLLHIYYGIVLWLTSRRGRGAKYVHANRRSETLSAKLQRWGGVTIGALLIFHILMFTTGTITPGFTYALHDPYSMFMGAFSQWWVVLVYVIFIGVVCLHVRHGFWSALTTLGANTGPGARKVINGLAYFVAILLFVGFVLPPVSVLFGIVS